MRRTSRSFLQVGAILGIVFGSFFLIAGFLMVLASTAKVGDSVLEMFESIVEVYFKNDWSLFLRIAPIYAVIFLVAAVCSIVSSIFAFISRNKPTKSNLIVVIVLSALGGSAFATLGAIFGLIANAQQNRAQLEQKQEQPVEAPREE